MAVKAAYLASLLFLALTLGASLAHLYALPNKLALSGEQYLAAQRAYDGWAMLGVVVIGALLSTLALAVLLHGGAAEFRLAALAFACVAASQAIFWSVTFPVNQRTANWTELPAGWEAMRRAWEYSHAAGAALNLAAFLLVALALVTGYGAERGHAL
jgi:hypothetical protein